MPVKPTAPKHTTEDLGDKLIISIPGLEKNWFLTFLLWFWLIFLMGVALYLSIKMFDTPSPFIRMLMSISIILMAVFGFVIYRIARDPTGKEIIEVTRQSIKIDWVVFGHHSPTDFLAEHIKDLRVSSSNVNHQLLIGMIYYFSSPSGLQVGPLVFDYGAQTFRFGSGIDEAEAKIILAKIQQKFPQYKN